MKPEQYSANMPRKTTWETFHAYCLEQGITLQDGVRDRVPTDPRRSLYYAMLGAAHLLRSEPKTKLANRQLPANPVPKDKVAEQLRTMINHSIQPLRAAGPTAFKTTGPTRPVDICADAEVYFGNHLIELQAPPANAADSLHTYLFVDKKRRPILLRKTTGAHSALALTDITINGIPYPSLSLLRMDAPEALQDEPVHIRPVSEVRDVAFMRVTSFCLPPDQRALYLPNHVRSTAREFSAARIAQIVQDAVRRP